MALSKQLACCYGIVLAGFGIALAAGVEELKRSGKGLYY